MPRALTYKPAVAGYLKSMKRGYFPYYSPRGYGGGIDGDDNPDRFKWSGLDDYYDLPTRKNVNSIESPKDRLASIRGVDYGRFRPKGVNTPTSTKSSTRGKFNFNSIAPYLSNTVNAFRRLPSPNAPALEAPITPYLENYDANRVAIDRNLLSTQKGFEHFADPQTVAAAKIAALDTNIQGHNTINQQEQNANAGIKNQNAQANSFINARNVERFNQLNRDLVERNLAQQNLFAENLGNLSDKYQMSQRDKAMFDLAKERNDLLPILYKDTGSGDNNIYTRNMLNNKGYRNGGRVLLTSRKSREMPFSYQTDGNLSGMRFGGDAPNNYKNLGAPNPNGLPYDGLPAMIDGLIPLQFGGQSPTFYEFGGYHTGSGGFEHYADGGGLGNPYARPESYITRSGRMMPYESPYIPRPAVLNPSLYDRTIAPITTAWDKFTNYLRGANNSGARSVMGNTLYGGVSKTGQYKHGGIYIKPSHRGRFTAYKKRTGQTTEQALHSKNPHVRQMANFALQASKWRKK